MPACLADASRAWTCVDGDEGDDEVGPELVEPDDEQREEDLVAQVRDLEDVLQAREQRPSSSPAHRYPGVRGYRLVSALPRAGGRPWPKGRGRISTLPPAASMAVRAEADTAWTCDPHGAVQLPPAEHLDQGTLADAARRHSAWSGVASSPGKVSRVSRFTTAYATRNGLWKPLSLGIRWASWQLTAFEPGRHGVAGACALGATARRLAALAGDAASHPALGTVGAGRRAQVVEFHASSLATRRVFLAGADTGAGTLPSATRRAWRAWPIAPAGRRPLVAGALHRHEMGDAGQHAPDLGAVGEDPAAAHAPQAQGPQRAAVLGLGADARADLGHPQVAAGAGGARRCCRGTHVGTSWNRSEARWRSR